MATKCETGKFQCESVGIVTAAQTPESTHIASDAGSSTKDEKEHQPSLALVCTEMDGERSLGRRISFSDLWRITNRKIIQQLRKVMHGARCLQTDDKNCITRDKGQLPSGLLLLSEQPPARGECLGCQDDEIALANEEPTAQPSLDNIDPEGFTAWLLTQTNAIGTLYLEDVARQYTQYLRSAPGQLRLSLPLDERNVFACHKVAELKALWETFRTAANYKAIARDTSYGFSVGLHCYERYLKHLAENQANTEPVHLPRPSLRSEVAIAYKPKNVIEVRSAQSGARPEHAALAPSPQVILDLVLLEKVTEVLSTHFANGYRQNSPIELVRFRRFIANRLCEEAVLSDQELERYIAACGAAFGGKVFAVSLQTKQRIRALAEEYFVRGAQSIFFAEFYAKNEQWLFGESVVSEDMLVQILRRLFPMLLFTTTYFGYTDVPMVSVLESEILRVWGDDMLLTYDQLAERLEYVPIERIKYALGQNGSFIWNSVQTFSHISRIDISDDERENIREAAMKICNARGYVSFTDLPLGEIEARNYELAATGVHNSVFRICLSDKFDKSGKIVTRKGDTIDALTIMKDYCRTIEKCSLADLLNYEKELTGGVHYWVPMEAGNAVLVRIDKESYVADRFVRFDTEAIDTALELCMEGDYLPLKSFTTFGAFPDCGQTWTLFLLESYCRRFSNKFRFDAPSVNSRNAGAVIRKSCGMNYAEIMTDAVAKTQVPLTENAIGRFLFEAGYTGRGTTSKANEIIDKAKAIRERKD